MPLSPILIISTLTASPILTTSSTFSTRLSDGSKVLGAFLPDRAYFGLMRCERYGMFLLLALSWFGVTGDLISGAILGIYRFFFELFF